MNITITGRHVDVHERLREHIQHKLEKLETVMDKVLGIHVIVGSEKQSYHVEANIITQGVTLTCEGEAEDIYSALDLLVDRAMKQGRKYREKMKDHRHRESFARAERKDLDAELAQAGEVQAPHVIPTRRFAVKPMSVDEAAMQMQIMEESFLVYRDAATGRVNVLYRRKDGNYGLIDPETN